MITGNAVKFGNNVDTDQIIGASYLRLATIADMAPHTFEFYKQFAEDFKRGDILVGEENFGCGSSREQAPAVLKERGVGAIVAKSFARIFYRNAINLGLTLVECDGADQINHGDELEIDLTSGCVRDQSTGAAYGVTPLPPFMQRILDVGGIVPYLEQKRTTASSGCHNQEKETLP